MDLSECPIDPASTTMRHPWESSRRRFAERLIRGVLHEATTPVVRMLDVGCGDGFVCTWLAARHADLRVDGVDPALSEDSIRRILANRPLANLHLATSLERIRGEDGKVGITLLMDVLEHLPDDASFLRAVVQHSAQAANSHFVITVPSIQALYCSHDVLLGHFRRYSRGQLCRLARESGLEIVESGSCYLAGFWTRGLRSLGERLRLVAPLRQTQVSAWRGGRWTTFGFERLLQADLAVSRLLARCKWRWPGLTCYAICRKADAPRAGADSRRNGAPDSRDERGMARARASGDACLRRLFAAATMAPAGK